ncbi:heterogeneous nuclear ribonucleoprotein, putative [Perkinsus marinus ATCC 50983]|uniref:Heterogeneous nuclear ribonucleoprotein, putative n=1 Tax=Perkinsus marinus (strain ATCC 50983 / TXsc) TaxID=423536 RepID=C5KRS3_PERM5|nr:heterogeneous nuclear ribonucleoprotein, putative [Perkinsus marinus ATCC 50983]EER12764.1 heterogeneous nuclear ribonucleoprotein, putative [Perkinsus marinus ATCC 50983]|eukprot:XP_002780969.1 heterogeneous nuclear ribonucleoprotein, putative [Perkinsus marinus ATCC 50983]
MSSSSSSNSSKDVFPLPHHQCRPGAPSSTTGLAGMATMKNTFLEFGGPAPEVSLRQRSKTLPVVPNMEELLRGSLPKGALDTVPHTSFDEEEEDDSDAEEDYDVISPPDRRSLSIEDHSAKSGQGSALGPHLGKAPPVPSATIDQLIAMQLLATLQTQQLHQGFTGVQFGLGSRSRRGRGQDYCVDSDDDLSVSGSLSSSEGGPRGRDYTLLDLDKQIEVSPHIPRGHGPPSSRANSAPTRNNSGSSQNSDSGKTTVMLRNIPNKYTQKILLNSIDGRGFEGTYDFFYLPIDFRNRCNLGYAFINFTTHESAVAFTNSFNGYSLPAFKSTKVCEVCWARVQGLEANVDHYRNSPVNEMPHNEYKPMLFARGQYIPFPMPPLPYAASGHPVEFPRPLSATDNSNQKLVVHQTPQHTGGGILQPPASKVYSQQDTLGSPRTGGAAMIRRNKIFIGGLSVGSTSEAIRQHFQQWGRVTEAAVITDKKTGQSRGFGFCTYAHDVPDEVLTAEHWVDGRNIGVRVYASGPPSAAPTLHMFTSPRLHNEFGFSQGEAPTATSYMSSGGVTTREYLSSLVRSQSGPSSASR